MVRRVMVLCSILLMDEGEGLAVKKCSVPEIAQSLMMGADFND